MNHHAAFKGVTILVWIALSTLMCSECLAAEPKTPIYLSSSMDGELGERFAFELKEQLRSSHGLRLVLSDSESSYRIHINALDHEDRNQLVYSVVWLIGGTSGLPSYSSSTVGYCGERVLADCARSVVARTDRMVSDDSRFWAEAAAELPKAQPKKSEQ